MELNYNSTRVQTMGDFREIVEAVDMLRTTQYRWACMSFGYPSTDRNGEGGYGRLRVAIEGLLTDMFDASTAEAIVAQMVFNGDDCMSAILRTCQGICDNEITAQRATDTDLAISRGHSYSRTSDGTYVMTYHKRPGMAVGTLTQAASALALVGRVLRLQAVSRDFGRGLAPFEDHFA